MKQKFKSRKFIFTVICAVVATLLIALDLIYQKNFTWLSGVLPTLIMVVNAYIIAQAVIDSQNPEESNKLKSRKLWFCIWSLLCLVVCAVFAYFIELKLNWFNVTMPMLASNFLSYMTGQGIVDLKKVKK